LYITPTCICAIDSGFRIGVLRLVDQTAITDPFDDQDEIGLKSVSNK